MDVEGRQLSIIVLCSGLVAHQNSFMHTCIYGVYQIKDKDPVHVAEVSLLDKSDDNQNFHCSSMEMN